MNTSAGMPGRMQQAVDVQPGQRRELRRLVEHRVAGQQRGDEHVAADEVRIVPGRDVGDDAERVVADALGHRRPRRRPSRACVAASTSARKKSMRARKPFSSLRDCASGLPTSWRQGLRQRLELGGDGEAKARDRDRALGERRRLPRGLRPARALRLGGDAGGVVGGHFGERRAVGGVDDLQGLHAVFAARAAARKSSRSGRVVERAFAASMELRVPLHGGHEADARDRRIASIMPSTGQRASTTKPGARSLTAWWWTLFTTAAPTPRRSPPAACPSRTRPGGRCGRRSRRCGARARRGRCVPMSCSSVPPKATFISCRPRQMPSTGLPRSAKAASSARLVVVADAIAAPLRLQRRLAIARRRDVGAAFEDERVEPVGVVGERDVALLRVAGGARDHHRDRAARHRPVGDRLLDVLQRLAGEDRPRRVGVEEARRDADLDAVAIVASSHRLPEQALEVARSSPAADWSGGRCRRRRSRPGAGSTRA